MNELVVSSELCRNMVRDPLAAVDAAVLLLGPGRTRVTNLISVVVPAPTEKYALDDPRVVPTLNTTGHRPALTIGGHDELERHARRCDPLGRRSRRRSRT